MPAKETPVSKGMPFEDSLKLLAAILAATVLGVNLSIVRPMKDRMAELQVEVAAMKSEMRLLVGQRDTVRSTNDLLAGLKAQKGALDEAAQMLGNMRQLRDQIVGECKKTSQALASVEQLAVLQQTVLRHRELTQPAMAVLDEIVRNQKALIDEQSNADDAADALNRLTALKRNLMAESIDANVAETGLAQMAEIKTQIMAQASDVPAAVDRTRQLIELKNQIVAGSGNIDIAEKNAARMIEINRKIAGKGNDLADAVRAVETLIDLQQEVQRQVRSLDGMRRGLMEIVMMESTVTNAVRMLQPLLELGNLRHLNQDDLRQIARAMSEQRATRLASNESENTSVEKKDTTEPKADIERPGSIAPAKAPVPMPTDLE